MRLRHWGIALGRHAPAAILRRGGAGRRVGRLLGRMAVAGRRIAIAGRWAVAVAGRWAIAIAGRGAVHGRHRRHRHHCRLRRSAQATGGDPPARFRSGPSLPGPGDRRRVGHLDPRVLLLCEVLSQRPEQPLPEPRIGQQGGGEQRRLTGLRGIPTGHRGLRGGSHRVHTSAAVRWRSGHGCVGGRLWRVGGRLGALAMKICWGGWRSGRWRAGRRRRRCRRWRSRR